MTDDSEILSHTEGGIGWITLNRPRALNALSLFMIRKLSHLLKEWEEAPSLKAIVIEGAGEKAFCAGGDVRAVYNAKNESLRQTCDAFFREEYTLNAYIHSYPKPYISLLDGIAMGGGLGISINGSHRIVTERSLLAMPETSIGFFSDASATTFLTKTPGKTGLYLGLTGARLKAACALWSGLGTHFIPSTALAAFKKDLSNGLEEALKTHCQPLTETGFLEKHKADIETHFSHTSVEDIFESLSHDNSPFAKETLATLKTKSPTSLKVVFRQLTEVAGTFEERMKTEFRLSQWLVHGHDFSEGVRAVLVHKDGAPIWNPTTLEQVTQETVNNYFAPLGDRELIL